MSDAIRIEDLSKQYRLGQIGTGTLSHDLNRWWARMRGKEDPYSKVGQVNRRAQAASGEYVWALKDINLTIDRGEVVGFVGANGAGKSTLLKLISRITSPTTGVVKARGRIASLLEVGTGMHPEMTARENIFLNGAILGMRRSEIRRKLDDIVDFAGCRMFTDTPVKRFSSGMRVRLGFAVAAFLEPEILIVDEVLAVGDAEFQDRCIGKMQEISSEGNRTILFVSHNMTSIENLCSRCVWLSEGMTAMSGKTEDVITAYLRAMRDTSDTPLSERTNRTGEGRIRFSDVCVTDGSTGDEQVRIGNPLKVKIWLNAVGGMSDLRASEIAMTITDRNGSRVTTLSSRFGNSSTQITGESGCLTFHAPELLLAEGRYGFNLWVGTAGRVEDFVVDAGHISVVDGNYFENGQKTQSSKHGNYVTPHSWEWIANS